MTTFAQNSISMILDVFSGLFFALFMFRFWFRACHIPFRTPIYQQILKATNWLVKYLQTAQSVRQKHDIASLLAATLVLLVANIIKLVLLTNLLSNIPVFTHAVLFFTLVDWIRIGTQLLFFTAVVYAITSWVQPQSHLYQLLGTLLAPILAPFDRIIPSLGGISLSLIVFILILQISSNGLILAIQTYLMP